jgi:predicted metalloprotease with PDZ domain
MMIRKNSGNRHSLDDVMRLLYLEFGKKGKGYTEQDYKDAVEKYAGKETASLFQRYYYGTEDFEPALSDALDYVGLEIIKSRSRLYFENRFGFKAVNNPSGSVRISFVAPGSVADKAGMAPDDEITSINGIKLQSNLKEWCKYFAEEETQFTLFKNQEYKSLSLMPGEERYYQVHYPYKKKNPSEVQKENFRLWNKHKF